MLTVPFTLSTSLYAAPTAPVKLLVLEGRLGLVALRQQKAGAAAVVHTCDTIRWGGKERLRRQWQCLHKAVAARRMRTQPSSPERAA